MSRNMRCSCMHQPYNMSYTMLIHTIGLQTALQGCSHIQYHDVVCNQRYSSVIGNPSRGFHSRTRCDLGSASAKTPWRCTRSLPRTPATRHG